jgi:peroxin-11B
MAGVMALDDPKSTKMTGAKFWLVGLTAGLILTIYQLKQNGAAIAKAADEDTAKRLKAQRSKIYYGLVKSSIDWFLPAARLGYVPIEDGHIGLMGTLTSIMGAYTEWNKLK